MTLIVFLPCSASFTDLREKTVTLCHSSKEIIEEFFLASYQKDEGPGNSLSTTTITVSLLFKNQASKINAMTADMSSPERRYTPSRLVSEVLRIHHD